jgi:hypothetical protein
MKKCFTKIEMSAILAQLRVSYVEHNNSSEHAITNS